MLSNSELIVMFNQAERDQEQLAELLNISKEQMGYVTDTEAGSGLIKYGRALVPFVNRFPATGGAYYPGHGGGATMQHSLVCPQYLWHKDKSTPCAILSTDSAGCLFI